MYHLKYARNVVGLDFYGSDESGSFGDEDEDEDLNSDLLYMQFSHSAAVSGSHYAVSADSISAGMTLDWLTKHIRFSAVWHCYIGLHNDPISLGQVGSGIKYAQTINSEE